MVRAPEAVQSDRDLERKHPESVVTKESAGLDTTPSLAGYLSAFGSDGSNGSSTHLTSPLMRHPANGAMRTLAMRSTQQRLGNHKTQQLVAQLRRSSVVQRQCSCGSTCASCQGKSLEEVDESKVVQRQAVTASAGAIGADESVIPSDSSGQPLDKRTREFMEDRFGRDFSDVRVHTDSGAAQSADALAADAYTTGRDIYFTAGKYAPGSHEGEHLIAHELTHTVQQENGATPMAASPGGGVQVGDAADPLEAEAERTADTVVGAGRGSPQISKDAAPALRRDAKSTAAALWDATGGRAGRAASALWDEAKETAAGFIDRMFPGLLPLLRNAGNFLYEKITSGMDAVFNGIASRVQKQGVAGAIAGFLSEIAGSIGKSLGQLVTGSCHSIVEAASSLIHFVKEIAGETFAELGKIAKQVGDFFSGIWQDYGAPALDAIKKVAGEAWGWIKEKAQWVWDKLLPIRNGFATAWSWIKKEFNLAKEETAGVLDWLYDKAKEQWMKIRDKIAPILGPLKIVAGALLLLSPLGPIILIWKGAPYLWKGLQWIWTHWLKPAGEWIKEEAREHILPYLLEGIDAITTRLDQASAFLCGHAGTISSALHSLEEALGSISFFKFASRMVGFVAGFFDSLAAKGKCKFSDVVTEVKSVLHRVHEFLRPVLELLRQAALVATFGPWAIVDDGVWKTLNEFVAFAKRTPCIREIAGLLQIDAVMAKVTQVRTVLKNIWEVISNKEKFEKAIHNALDGFLDAIPGKAEALLGALDGLDGPHLHTLLKNYLAPKIAAFIAGAPRLLIDMVWDQVWPWPGVMKDVDEIEKQVDKLKQALWDFNFSKATDAGLAIWRGVNGVAGHLFTWFTLAAVLIGSVFGAPEAGLEVAEEVGEALLLSTIAAEGLSIDKAKFNLMSRTRLVLGGKEREEADKEDYETIADSTMNVAILAVMLVLGPIAEDFAQSVLGEIKGIFLREGEEAPKIELPPEKKPVEPTPAEVKGEGKVGEGPGKRVVEEKPTADGQHKIEVTEDGECLFCSDCVALKKAYAKELADPANAALKSELDAAEKITDPLAKAQKEVELEAKLAKARRKAELSYDPARGREDAGTRSEADSILQAEDEGAIKGKARRADRSKGERPTSDFILEDAKGKPIGYAEVKSPVDPAIRSLNAQAGDIAPDVLIALTDPTTEVVIDVKNLNAADKTTFLSELQARGVNLGHPRVLVLNK